MKKKILCFDIDNVICYTKKSDYKNSKPIKKNIQLINFFYSKGFFIKIFTSRFMGRNNENTFKAKSDGYSFTKNQLNKWGLKYHKLIFGKPSYDLFIDDKCLFYEKNWGHRIKKILKLK
jgi:hypothetical protein